MDLILELLISKDQKSNELLEIEIENSFHLPIEMIDSKLEINQNIVNDLELIEFKNDKYKPAISRLPDISNSSDISDISDISDNLYNENLYYSILEPKNSLDKCIASKWGRYYSNDKNYLLETQNLVKNFKNNVNFEDEINFNENIFNSSKEIIKDYGFTEKYQYIDLPYFNKYNNDELCMQVISIFNLANPVLTLLAPIVLLLLPFFIIKIQGHAITLESYLKHLKQVFSNHIIGQFFNDFYDAPISTKIYLMISIIFYVFQTYQNVIGCGKFYKNIKYIHSKLFELREYITNSINKFKNLLKYTETLLTYDNFNKNLNENIKILNNYLSGLNNIKEYNISFSKLFQLGHLMKYFYKLHNDKSIIKSLYFSFGCNSYIQNIVTIQKHIKNNTMNFTTFIENDKKTNFKNAYYSELLRDSSNNNIIKNSYKFDNNLILTGPNAAGKTTLLKSTLFNILLSQQIGCGFFDKAECKIYDFIHCYINIPDTSGRDSLFQAEARRCKEIIDLIENNNDKNHFCVFDELYSGTNPEEAISSASALLNHLNKKNNINYCLTTHYYKLCKQLDKNVSKNYHMEIIKNKDNTDFKFTYKIKKGISKIKGGLKVLKDLEYPDDIIKQITNA
tara:strand:+ start:5521 stop:7386 length:1866 start_codon:yes stop_codon:yes gene_type:complete